MHKEESRDTGEPPVLRQESVTRRNLPHWYVPGAMHFVTYRLYGTLPGEVRERLQTQKRTWLNQRDKRIDEKEHRGRVHKRLFAEYDQYLDQTSEVAWLRDSRIAAIVRSNLYHHDGSKYHLLSYCIMPNHVHVLLQPIDTSRSSGGPPEKTTQASGPSCGDVGEQTDKYSPLAKIMHSLKSYVAHEANKILNRSGTFWQAESYDHWIRDQDELENVVNYIADNPVSAGLVKWREDWFWSSAHDSFLEHGEPTGWLGSSRNTDGSSV